MERISLSKRGPAGWFPPLPPTDRKKIRFSPFPPRGIADQRFEKSHYKLLLAISYRDGMRKDGKGCYARQATLAVDADLNPSTVSTSIKNLIDWGYLGHCPHPKDARQNVYWVKFDYEVENQKDS